MRLRPLLPSLVLILGLLCAGAAQAQGKDLFAHDSFRTFSLKLAQPNWLALIKSNKASGTYIRGDLTVDGTTYKSVGVRGRGATTWGFGLRTGKVPFKISFDQFVPGRRFHGRRALNLNNGALDPSFLREVLVFRLMRRYVPAPEANFIKLVINGQNWGVYTLMEPVNKDFLRRWWEHADGNRYKGTSNFFSRLPLKSSLRKDSHKDLALAQSKLRLPWPQRGVESEKLIDIDAAHRVLALNSVFSNSDSFPGHNYYVYVDPHHNQLHIIPWDVNLAFGGAFVGSVRPRIFAGPTSLSPWDKQFQAHVRTIVEETDLTELARWVVEYQTLIGAEVKRETRSLYSFGAFLAGPVAIANRLKVNIAAVKVTLGPTQVQFSGVGRAPREPSVKETVWVSIGVKGVLPILRMRVHWRTRGYYRALEMFDDGKHRDGKAGDGVYGVGIPPLPNGSRVSYYFSADTANAITFHPSNTNHDPYTYQVLKPTRTMLLISEFLASNKTGLKDEKGEREDWIELVNPTSAAIDVGGMFLTDDVWQPKQWRLPKGIVVQGGARLLIWADADVGDGPLHASFKLSAAEDRIYLTDKDGTTLLDYVEFRSQQDDVSTGRLEDGVSPFVMFDDPTPVRSNVPPPCGMRTYSALSPARHPLGLRLRGTPRINNKVTFELSGGGANGTYLLMAALKPAAIPVPGLKVSLLVGAPLALTLAIPGGAKGTASLPVTIPSAPGTAGLRLALQTFAVVNIEVVVSNGLELHICK